MAHPTMFDDDDLHLTQVRELALELPDAAEKVSHGRPAFFTKKVFAYYSGSLRMDGEWVQHPQSIVVRTEVAELLDASFRLTATTRLIDRLDRLD